MFELRGIDAKSTEVQCLPEQHEHFVDARAGSGVITIQTHKLAEQMDQVRAVSTLLKCQCGAVTIGTFDRWTERSEARKRGSE